MNRTKRSHSLRWLAAVALVIAAGCGSGAPARVDQRMPAGEVLQRLCDELFEVADEEFVAASQASRIEQSLGATGPANSVSCEGDGWDIESDGEQHSRVELAVIFKPVRDPAAPESDYCDTEGVTVSVPVTGYEEREFDGNPYCFSWYSGDRSHVAAASYIDRSTEIYLTWRIATDTDPFDTDTELGALFAAAQEAVLTRVYETFGEAD
ncbi:MAG TPA: hypothetical protein VIL37_12345 [Natronosporangium sp.]